VKKWEPFLNIRFWYKLLSQLALVLFNNMWDTSNRRKQSNESRSEYTSSMPSMVG